LVFLEISIIYSNDLSTLANEALQNEASNYILLLPFLFGILLYIKRNTIRASLIAEKNRLSTRSNFLNELLGVDICLIALMIYWYGSYTFYPLEYHLISLPIFIMGITLFLSNPQTLRAIIFPITFLYFLIPIPATILYTAGGAMANLNTQISYSILKTIGLPITVSSSYGAPTVILTNTAGQTTNFSVDVACSGIYSIIAFAMFAFFLVFLLNTTITKKITVFAIGFTAFAALNLTRIITIFSAGYLFGEETALIIHAFAGFILIFIGMLLTLTISEKLLKVKLNTKPTEQTSCSKCKTNTFNSIGFCPNCGKFLGKHQLNPSKNTYAKLLLLLLFLSLAAFSIRAPTFATAQGSIEFLSSDNWQNPNNVFPHIQNYTLQFLYRDTAYEEISHQDASLMYGYFANNTSEEPIYADIGVASTLSDLHNWEVCYITLQTANGQYPLVNVLEQKTTQLINNPPIVGQFLMFDSKNNYTQVTLYWYEKAAFKIGLTVEQKYVRISLIVLTKNSANYPEIEQNLLNLGKLTAAYWEPLKTQALISLGIPAQQALLGLSVSFLIVTETTNHFTTKRKENNAQKIFNIYASAKEKIVLTAVTELSKENKQVKTIDVIKSVQNLVGKPVNPQTVLTILKTLERQGFVKQTLLISSNSPILVWKA
jgi:exosortase/archaeosortase family protein